jgi:hypothetical protein
VLAQEQRPLAWLVERFAEEWKSASRSRQISQSLRACG